MAYTNFIPSVWAETINRELERACVFVEDCNRQYEGLVSSKGDSVHILGVVLNKVRNGRMRYPKPYGPSGSYPKYGKKDGKTQKSKVAKDDE